MSSGNHSIWLIQYESKTESPRRITSTKPHWNMNMFRVIWKYINLLLFSVVHRACKLRSGWNNCQWRGKSITYSKLWCLSIVTYASKVWPTSKSWERASSPPSVIAPVLSGTTSFHYSNYCYDYFHLFLFCSTRSIIWMIPSFLFLPLPDSSAIGINSKLFAVSDYFSGFYQEMNFKPIWWWF